MTTVLATKAAFVKNVTLHVPTNNVYQLVESHVNGAATLKLVGLLEDVPQWVADALASDDRARCTL